LLEVVLNTANGSMVNDSLAGQYCKLLMTVYAGYVGRCNPGVEANCPVSTACQQHRHRLWLLPSPDPNASSRRRHPSTEQLPCRAAAFSSIRPPPPLVDQRGCGAGCGRILVGLPLPRERRGVATPQARPGQSRPRAAPATSAPTTSSGSPPRRPSPSRVAAGLHADPHRHLRAAPQPRPLVPALLAGHHRRIPTPLHEHSPTVRR
jgi:hypothetical protein